MGTNGELRHCAIQMTKAKSIFGGIVGAIKIVRDWIIPTPVKVTFGDPRAETQEGNVIPMNEQRQKMSWTVFTVDGRRTIHMYDVPSETNEAFLLVVSTAKIIHEAMRGDSPYLVLTNPAVTYNPDHIVSIRLDTYGSKGLEDALEQAQRKKEFRPPVS